MACLPIFALTVHPSRCLTVPLSICPWSLGITQVLHGTCRGGPPFQRLPTTIRGESKEVRKRCCGSEVISTGPYHQKSHTSFSIRWTHAKQATGDSSDRMHCCKLLQVSSSSYVPILKLVKFHFQPPFSPNNAFPIHGPAASTLLSADLPLASLPASTVERCLLRVHE